jgi:hypothetical protein
MCWLTVCVINDFCHPCCYTPCALQVGAIIADIVFGYVDKRMTFYLSAAFGLVGWIVGWLFLPDTTGMSLDELDRCVPTTQFESSLGLHIAGL